MKLYELAEISLQVTRNASRLTKIGHLAECLRRLEPGEIPIAVAYLCGELPQGKIGIGWSMLKDTLAGPASGSPALTLAETDACFETVRQTTGSGSSRRRSEIFAALMARASETERDFLQRLVLGEMRHGALEGVMMEAVARASGLASRAVRRAYFVTGSLGHVATVAVTQGEAGLSGLRFTPGRPILPALAQPCDDVSEALRQLGTAALEYKMDGARVQVHKMGPEVSVFTRGLRDVAPAVPELVECARALAAREVILDGEVLAIRRDGRPHPFQTTMRRFGRKLDVAALRGELPLTPYFFDCLYLDGETLIDLPGGERIAALAATVPCALRMPRMVTDSPAAARDFFASAVAAGHEGVMAKTVDGVYEAGERSRNWLKIKRVHTLDLVVLAAEWGHGRRRGWLSNLHLGARDPSDGSFVMLGKTFKGLTDAMLVEQTELLQRLETGQDRHTVYVRPEVVVEVAFNDLQASPQYPAGLALRFARVKRYRPDKRAEQADTIEAVRAIYAAGVA